VSLPREPALSAANRRSTVLIYGVLPLLFLVAEFLIFDARTSRHYTWVYPRWNDQIQYLTESYTGFEYLRLHGFWAGIWQTLVNPAAQGTLHDFYAVLLFIVAGPSRSAALAVNMLALIAWQAALFFVTARTTRSSALAWAALALPLALRAPWSGQAGSAIDFRLDHLAMCTLGVTSAFALLTDGFRATRWSALFGFAVGVTLLTRFLTGTYFALIFLCLLIWLLFFPNRLLRLGNLFLAAGVATFVAGPVFWLNRTWVWDYYMIGHFTGPESAIRNPHMGLIRSLDFVWGHFTYDQAGLGVAWLGLTAAIIFGATAWWDRKTPAHGCLTAREWWPIGTFLLLAPALILTLHQQKSDVVIGALVPGALILLIALWTEFAHRWSRPGFLCVVAAGIVVTSGVCFVARQIAPAYDAGFAVDARKVNTLADYVYHHARAAKLNEPRVAVDQVTDCLDGQVLRVIVYERQHLWVPFIMTLPTGIAEADPKLIMDRLAGSDFVFLTEDGPVGSWPYDRQLRALLPQTQAWCEDHLKRVEQFTLFGRRMVLYQRREIP
jgi:hypothetical protein